MTPSRLDAEKFCPVCHVSRDLHVWPEAEEPEAWDCEVARQKADLMDRFYGMLVRG